MKSLQNKIRDELVKRGRLHELAKDEGLSFKKAMELYQQIENSNNKIKFLKDLSSALNKYENKKRREYEISNKK